MKSELTNEKVLLSVGLICLFAVAVITGVILITPKGGQCVVNGVTYENGANFKSTDGCNMCACSNGEATCTDMGCFPTEETPGGAVDDPISPILPIKGVEVYCWDQGNATYYSVLPGTNRMKSYLEVTDPKYSYSKDNGNEFQMIKVTEAEATQFMEVQLGLTEETIKDMLLSCTPADDLL